jgi:hypothetical protein
MLAHEGEQQPRWQPAAHPQRHPTGIDKAQQRKRAEADRDPAQQQRSNKGDPFAGTLGVAGDNAIHSVEPQALDQRLGNQGRQQRSGGKSAHLARIIGQSGKPLADKQCQQRGKDEQRQPVDHPSAQPPQQRQGYCGIMFGKSKAQWRSSGSGDQFQSGSNRLTPHRLLAKPFGLTGV